MTMPSIQDTGWSGLLSTALNIGASIYQGSILRRQQKAAIKAQTNDFPQLGMGLGATGPQRGPVQMIPPGASGIGVFGPGSFVGAMGIGGGDVSMPGDNLPAVRGSRFPTQLAVYTTPNGTMRVGGYRSIGTPLLWSGDLAAVRRVARVARKLGSWMHRGRGRKGSFGRGRY